MKQNRISIGRRDFLKAGSLAVVSAAIAGSAGRAAAQAARLDEKDAQAQSLGYKHDATKVDKAKFAKYVAGQRSEEHTSELHHITISYAVFCLKKKNRKK